MGLKIISEKIIFLMVILLMIYKALTSPTSVSKKIWPPMKHHDIWNKPYKSKPIHEFETNFFNENFKNISSSLSRHSKGKNRENRLLILFKSLAHFLSVHLSSVAPREKIFECLKKNVRIIFIRIFF